VKWRLGVAVDRIFMNELNGNPNKKNSHDETCLHILCSAQSSAVTAEEATLRLECIELLLEWSGPADETTATEEKLDHAAVDEVSQIS